MLAKVSGVEPALFVDNSQSKVVLKIKDFQKNIVVSLISLTIDKSLLRVFSNI